MKDEKRGLLLYSRSTSNKWKNPFCQVKNVQGLSVLGRLKYVQMSLMSLC
jgi:hypothetical protein